MSPRKTDQIGAALTSKGFQAQDTHHEMYWLYVDGKKTSVRTRLSHGEREYGDNLLGQMAKQVGLVRRELDDLIDCPLTGPQYRALLIERGRVKIG